MNCKTNRFIADVRVREGGNGCRRCGCTTNRNVNYYRHNKCGCNCGCHRPTCGCHHNRPNWNGNLVVEGEFRVFEPECSETPLFEESNQCNE